MRYVFQFGILCVIYYIGEWIVRFANLPVPGSVVGLILLFLLLRTGVVRREHVEDTGRVSDPDFFRSCSCRSPRPSWSPTGFSPGMPSLFC